MNVSPLAIEHLFSTTLIIDVPPEHAVDRTQIAAAISLAAQQRRGPPHAAWSSSDPAEPWAKSAHSLGRHAAMLANRMTADISHTARTTVWRIGMSAHLAHGGEIVTIPRAYDAYWSGVYVVDDGYAGSPEAETGGEFVILDPRLPAPMMEMPHLRLRTAVEPRPAIYAPEVTITPGSGTLYLFPGWLALEHRVLCCPGPRILVGLSLVAQHEIS